jgi:hypothetical protein
MSEQEYLAGPAWDADRAKYEQFIAEHLRERGRMQDWFKPNGQMNAKGKNESLQFIIGMGAALHMVGHPAAQWMINQAFLSAVRGVEDRFLKEEAQ